MVSVERSHHLVSFNDLQGRGRNGGGGPHTNILTSKAHFPKKFAWPQNGDNCLLVGRAHGEFHPPALNVHERPGEVSLGENSCSCCEAFV